MENINFSEEKFKIIFDHDPDAYYISDLKGNFIDGNEAAEALIGHKKADFIGKHYSKINIVSKSQTSEFDELFSKSALGQDTGPDEFIFNRKDGQEVDVEVRTVPIELEDENLVLWIVRDITLLKRADSVKAQLAAVVKYSQDAIVSEDLDGNFKSWNKGAEKIYGYSADEIIGKNLSILIPPDNLDELPKIIDKMKKNEPLEQYETLRVRKDGKIINVALTMSPVKNANGDIEGFSAIARDITERKKMGDALEWEVEVNKALAKLSSKLLSSASIEEISDLVLKYAKRLTESEFGFVGYIDPDTGFIVLTTMTRDIWDQCQVPDKSAIFEKFGGLWGWVLDNKESLVTNNPEEDPRSTGTPEGHIKIQRFLSAPALIGEKLVGQVALANSKREYNEQDVLLVERLADIYAIAIKRKQSEDALKISEEKYRRIVETFIKRVTEILGDLN
ncbi:MAG: PAS domain S-box protein [Methanobacterium sp.]|uniref:PAS domain S-box protein n=1 Tax=Methanobacterium sp. TaxID=2164 RepID=UPI003D6623BB|nr:PAS domain S-box protein [Methanobacterium sp.]